MTISTNLRWRWFSLRVHTANVLMRWSLAALPPCRYRSELEAELKKLNLRVSSEVSAWRQQHG